MKELHFLMYIELCRETFAHLRCFTINPPKELLNRSIRGIIISAKVSSRLYVHSNGMMFSEIKTNYDFTDNQPMFGDLRYERFEMLKYGTDQCEKNAQVDLCRHEALFEVMFTSCISF